MERYLDFLKKHGKLVIMLFFLAAALGGILSGLGEVTYGLAGFLPAEAGSVVALQVMEEEYGYRLPELEVMLQEVSVPEALAQKREMEALEGVVRAEWLDDVADLHIPLEMADPKVVEGWYREGKACIRLTVREGREAETVEQIRQLVGEQACMAGPAVQRAAAAREGTGRRGWLPIVLIVLVLSSWIFVTGSWVEPILLAFTTGTALLLARGLILCPGRISFVTHGALPLVVLSLAGSGSACLLHLTAEYREGGMEGREAMETAWKRLAWVIFCCMSCAAVCGLVLTSGEYGLGPELGRAMILSGVVCLVCTLCLLPALVFACDGLIRRTSHGLWRAGSGFLAEAVVKMRGLFLLLAISAAPVLFLAQENNAFYHGEGEIYGTAASRLGRDAAAIRETFGSAQTLVLMVPRGDPEKETAMDRQLQELAYVSGVASYPSVVGNAVPDPYASDGLRSRFYSAHYSLHSLLVDAGETVADWEERVEAVRNIGEKYYGDKLLYAGGAVNTQELKACGQKGAGGRRLMACLLLAGMGVLCFRRLSFTVALLLPWAWAICLDLGIPYLTGETVFHAGYLSAGMLTAGVGMGFLMIHADRYADPGGTLSGREAALAAVRTCIPVLLAAVAAPAAAGFWLYRVSDNGLLRQMGLLVGRGLIFLAASAILLQPGLLLLSERLPALVPSREGRRKTDGRKRVPASGTDTGTYGGRAERRRPSPSDKDLEEGKERT